MEQDPILKTQDQRPPRPESLKELYGLMVKMCPSGNHDRETYLKFIIEVLMQPHIELQYREQRSMIEKEGLDFALASNLPINNYWTAADKYLKNLGIAGSEISKFDIMMSKGFS
ncbi:MAG: hypothetical protein Q7K54_06120 [Candidatus Parcubacteria bacterium]|nr:hypothetical protein [Candidatus Parcubacteria bacterium]